MNVTEYKKGIGKMCGIYQIRNIINDKVYIGSTADKFSKRKAYHFLFLRRNKHHSQKLQRSFNKYGEKSFVFEILELCSPEDCIKKEQLWIDLKEPYKREVGYNILKIAGSCRGRKLTEEHKRKISLSEKGKFVSLETRKKLSKASKGRGLGIKKGPPSEETKRKIGLANTGRVMAKETKIKISQKLMGKIVSEETKAKFRIVFGKPVVSIDKQTGNIIEKFISCAEVERKYGYLNQGISRACLTNGSYYGFKWRYI